MNQHKRPHTKWYDEGKLARKLGKTEDSCPYLKYTYGYTEWMRGYLEDIPSYIESSHCG